MKICVIGLGLIGGSMAIDLKKRGFCKHVAGVDTNAGHAIKALDLGIVDEIVSLENGVKESDLVILAVPADATLKLLPDVMNLVNEQIVTDVCSTKESICESIKNHPKRMNFVAGHPMAGTEFSGPEAAFPGLFDGKATIICEDEKSSDKAKVAIQNLYETLNMRIIKMDSKNHDVHAAYVSHISHISSFALALTVLEQEANEKNIFDLASGGFDSTVRLAKSSAAMWAPILADNSENVTQVLQTYIDRLNDFKTAIEKKDLEAITQNIEEANKIKKILAEKNDSPIKEIIKPVFNNLNNN